MIDFVHQLDVAYASVETLSPLVRRVVARNPGPFTYTGTGVFIIGHGEVAVIDPGPLLPEHEAALHAALAGERVTHVLVTHHHMDHSPLAHPLARRHGCRVHAMSPGQAASADTEVRLEAGDDARFRPDQEVADGDVFAGPGWTLTALHTPGHTSNHVCFALAEENTLFSGDHVMGWSTSVVSPPDGHMGDYLAALERVRDAQFDLIRPTHGPAIEKTAILPLSLYRPPPGARASDRGASRGRAAPNPRAGRGDVRPCGQAPAPGGSPFGAGASDPSGGARPRAVRRRPDAGKPIRPGLMQPLFSASAICINAPHDH